MHYPAGDAIDTLPGIMLIIIIISSSSSGSSGSSGIVVEVVEVVEVVVVVVVVAIALVLLLIVLLQVVIWLFVLDAWSPQAVPTTGGWGSATTCPRPDISYYNMLCDVIVWASRQSLNSCPGNSHNEIMFRFRIRWSVDSLRKIITVPRRGIRKGGSYHNVSNRGIYIYIYRERETCVCIYLSIYIYIYIYIHTCMCVCQIAQTWPVRNVRGRRQAAWLITGLLTRLMLSLITWLLRLILRALNLNKRACNTHINHMIITIMITRPTSGSCATCTPATARGPSLAATGAAIMIMIRMIYIYMYIYIYMHVYIYIHVCM